MPEPEPPFAQAQLLAHGPGPGFLSSRAFSFVR